MAYMGGGGEWDRGCGVWPGVAACIKRKIGGSGIEDHGVEGEACAVTSRRAWVVGPGALTAPGNRKRRATWVGQKLVKSNRWRSNRVSQISAHPKLGNGSFIREAREQSATWQPRSEKWYRAIIGLVSQAESPI